jgi:transposase
MLIGMRSRLIHNRTQLTNAIRGFAMEFGLTTGTGTWRVEPLLDRIAEDVASRAKS